MGTYYAGIMNATGGSYLRHHGIMGQKWGVRRWQNEDGSLTPEGRIHYGYKSERKITDSGLSNFVDHIETTALNIYGREGYRDAKLNSNVSKRLDKIIDDAYKDSKIEEGRKYFEEAKNNANTISSALFDRKRSKAALKDSKDNERDATLEYCSLIGDNAMKYISKLPEDIQKEAMLYVYRNSGFDW